MHATVFPQRNHFVHELITQVSLRSLQYGIEVLGSTVCAHHQHRRSFENPGNFGDCMKGRIRFMTAITLAYAHAYLATSLTGHMPAVPRPNFCLPKHKARYPYLPNVVAKKRDASTEPLQFFHSKMLEFKVDFIGGDFNMIAFSTVSDVFSDPEFSAPGHSCLWGLGALDEQYRECTGFLIMPKRPYEWRVDSHGCYKTDNSALGLGLRDQSAHLPVFLHLSNTNIPGPSSSMRSEHAQQRRLERKRNKERRQR